MELSTLGVIQGPASLTPQQIDAILGDYGSPTAGSGQAFYDAGVRAGIDPAYALAFFVHSVRGAAMSTLLVTHSSMMRARNWREKLWVAPPCFLPRFFTL